MKMERVRSYKDIFMSIFRYIVDVSSSIVEDLF